MYLALTGWEVDMETLPDRLCSTINAMSLWIHYVYLTLTGAHTWDVYIYILSVHNNRLQTHFTNMYTTTRCTFKDKQLYCNSSMN